MVVFTRCNPFTIAKKYEEFVDSIEKIDKSYIVKLKEGQVWTWGKGEAICHNQIQVKQALKSIVMPIKETKSSEKTKKARKSKGGSINSVVNKGGMSEIILIVSSYLKGEKTEKELISQFGSHHVKKAFAKYELKRSNFANFLGLSMSKIFATLKFYKRSDLVEVFEKSYKLEVA